MPNFISAPQAARILPQAQRVLVIGCSGLGKTTLSRKLSDQFDLPYWSVDRDVFWLPGWTPRDRGDQRRIIADIIAGDRWLMDGSNSSTFDLRLPRADLVIWLNLPRRVALWGLARRVAANYGRVRFGMAEGCPEKLPDREFLSYVWTFDRIYPAVFAQKFDQNAPDLPVVRLRSRQEVNALVAASGARLATTGQDA
jgi:adenylate kinase family enzyme